MEAVIISGKTLFSRRSLLGSAVLATAGNLLPSAAIGALSNKHQQQFRDINKSLWIWQTSLNQLPDVLKYAQRWNFKTLLYSIPPNELKNLMAIDSAAVKLINKARRQDGFKFIALSGDPRWAYRGNTIPKSIQDILTTHRNTGNLFDGLQLDIEPHILKAWRSKKRRQLAEGYYQLMKAVSREAKELKLPLGAAIHPSYARVAVPSLGSSIVQSVMPYLSEVSITAYRNVPRRSLRRSSLTLRQLIGARTRWRMGVATQNSRDAQKVSYVEKSPEYFVESLSKMDALARTTRAHKNYAGIAIQHYQAVTRLTGN